MQTIKTTALTKYYGKSRGIIDINLTIEEGDFFGFIGPNGAGKSTTIRTLLGLLSPTSGKAEIFGKDVQQHKEDILADIGYMPSEANFYDNMKVQEVIRLSANLRRKDCHDEADKLCERLELDRNKKIRELSLGNRKKVSIVCALQHQPRVCILDEPTSGLDPLMQHEFHEILRERNDAGTTIFLSSHVLSEVQRYCKHAAIIREGKLIVTDCIENLGAAEAKHVTIRGASHDPDLPHMKNVKRDGDSISFLYSGNPTTLLKALSELDLTDINISEPNLEEIFMHYYEKGEH